MAGPSTRDKLLVTSPLRLSAKADQQPEVIGKEAALTAGEDLQVTEGKARADGGRALAGNRVSQPAGARERGEQLAVLGHVEVAGDNDEHAVPPRLGGDRRK